MNRKYVRTSSNMRLASPKHDGTPATVVRQGLAYSPAQMAKALQEGRPISSPNIDRMFYDGKPDPSFIVDLERKRGADIAELWNEQKAVRAKIAKFKKSQLKDKQK